MRRVLAQHVSNSALKEETVIIELGESQLSSLKTNLCTASSNDLLLPKSKCNLKLEK